MNVEKSLQKAGVDTKKYPSLSMQNILGYQGKVFAENSYWYKKIMKDGHVFNPYVHRRWLPYQFMNSLYWEIHARYGNENREITYEYMLGNKYSKSRNTANWPHMYEAFEREINALYTLSKRDKRAYKERVAAFDNLDILEYVSGTVDSSGMGDETFENLKDWFDEEKYNATRSWRIADCLLYKNSDFRADLVKTTFRSGIYFTLKHIAMFDYENLHMSTKSQKEFLKMIRDDVIKGVFPYKMAFDAINSYVKTIYRPR